jgi:ferredoxin
LGRSIFVECRIDVELLKAHLTFGDYDFYLCGPPAFMQSLHDGLRALNIGEARIHAEAFGPSALKRDQETGGIGMREVHPAAAKTAKVVFTRSTKEARWKPGSGTLLELAEERGLSPSYSCRAGNCGECRARLVKGNVSYLFEPTFPVETGEALICCSVPAEGDDRQLDL